MHPVRILPLDFRYWLHSEGPGASSLYRLPDGKRCPLGSYLHILGVSDALMVGQSSPDDVVAALPHEADWLFSAAHCDHGESPACRRIITTNDALWRPGPAYAPWLRQKMWSLTSIFAQHGVAVTWTHVPDPIHQKGRLLYDPYDRDQTLAHAAPHELS